MSRLARLFTIRTKFEAFLVIYAIALGAVERGRAYQASYEGAAGWLLFAACLCVVFVAGGKLIDAIDAETRLVADKGASASPRR